jgi:CheY-like chemotaxis protein
MVYGMMQRHEGNIEIESTAGQGTCVRLIFPIREVVAKTTEAALIQPEQSEGLHLLCIDDEPNVREMVVDSLGGIHKVEAAPSGARGLEMFRSALRTNRPYDVVITDLGMPEVDGHQVAREIKGDSPNTPIIMLTGWGTMMKQDGEATIHADAIVGKPAAIKELNELVLRLNAKRGRTGAKRTSAKVSAPGA